MTPDEVRVVARAAAKEAVHETLQLLGMDPDDPTEAQRDQNFLRSWRLSTDAVKRQSMTTIIIVVVSGILGLIWLAVKGP